jgi:hypothetical protein
MKLLIMQFPPIFRHIIPPRSKYSPQHPVLKHPQSMFLPILQQAMKTLRRMKRLSVTYNFLNTGVYLLY